jgi:hypothetical protein
MSYTIYPSRENIINRNNFSPIDGGDVLSLLIDSVATR